MKTLKKRYLFPLLMMYGAHHQAHGKSNPANWFDHISWSLFDNRTELDFEHELKMLKKQEKRLEQYLQKTRQDIENTIKKSDEFKAKRNSGMNHISDSFEIEEKRLDKGANEEYQVLVHLPGFEEQELKITADTKKNQLHISGTKIKEIKQEKTEEAKNNKTASETYFSEEFVSSQNINGKKRKLKYKNGTIDITVDLPEDIKSKNFDTSFENGVLTVSFK